MKRVMIEAVLLLAAMMFGIIIFEGCSGDDDDVADQSAGNDDSGTIDEGDPYHTNSARLNVACVTVG